MGRFIGPSEGGSGGKRGHSNMDHWGFNDEVKEEAKKQRRLDKSRLINEQLNEGDVDETGLSTEDENSI